MNERFCRLNKLGSCYGCPTIDIYREERMANPQLDNEVVLGWVAKSECPPGERPIIPSSDNIRKISSERWIRR